MSLLYLLRQTEREEGQPSFRCPRTDEGGVGVSPEAVAQEERELAVAVGDERRVLELGGGGGGGGRRGGGGG